MSFLRRTPLLAVTILSVVSAAQAPSSAVPGVTALAQATGQQPQNPPAPVEPPGSPAQVPAQPEQTQQRPTATPPGVEGGQESPNELDVTVGKSLIVSTAQPIERISVGYNDVAEATAVSPHEVLVNGKAPGETSLIVWEQGGNKLFFDLISRPNTYLNEMKLDAVRREIKKELPQSKINLSYENDTAFLRGRVDTLTDSDRAVSIASTLGRTINLLYVSVPPPEKQILLKVRFASVDRQASTQLGLSLITTGGAKNTGSLSTGQFAPASGTITGGGSSPGNQSSASGIVSLSDAVNLFLFRPDLNLGAALQALESRGLTEVLAEPNVLAINGRLASFLAGGEFPYPIVQGGGLGVGQVTIAFREFGVRINFIPTITPRGTIRLDVAPEVSALDFGNGLTFQGFVIPGLSVRRVRTNIELAPGQSFAISGLLDRRLTDTIDKIPLLGDIPILGKIFQSRNRQKTNTELLVIITPELVRPIPEGQPVPGLKYPKEMEGYPYVTQVPRTPGMDSTGPVPVTPPKDAIPVEQMIQSLRLPRLEQGGGSGLQDSTFQPSLEPVLQQLQQPAAPAAAPAPAAPPK